MGEGGAAVEQLMTLREVATLVQVPPKTIYRWRSLGQGPPGLRIGRHVRFRREDVEAWIETRLRVRRP